MDSKFEYKINKFEGNILEVTFLDGYEARVILQQPFPQNQEELEDILRQYALSEKEYLLKKEQAKVENELRTAEPDVDISFIEGLVNKVLSSDRKEHIEKPTQEEIFEQKVEEYLKKIKLI